MGAMMSLDDSQLAILKTELDTDPDTLGYDDNAPNCADLLNAISGTYSVEREYIDGQELQMVVVISDYVALPERAVQGWQAIISAGSGMVNIIAAEVQIGAIWGEGTTTRANLLALKTRDASRTEDLFGSGVSVTKWDVSEARNG